MKIFLLFLAILNSSAAFSVQSIQFSRQLTLNHHGLESFERAVECAEKFGACDIEQMEELAKALEEFRGAYFESSDASKPSMMQKEVHDRKDVAEVLRLQCELRRRMDYLNGASLFTKDVHDMEDAYPEHQ